MQQQSIPKRKKHLIIKNISIGLKTRPDGTEYKRWGVKNEEIWIIIIKK